MTRLRIVMVALTLGGCPDPVTPGPLLSVQRRQHDAGCWATMTALQPAAALGLTDMCPAAAASRHLSASADQLRLISDYGDVTFGAGVAVPAPLLTLTLDGVDTPSGINLGGVQRDGGRVWFASTFPAPARAARVMQVSVKVTEGFASTVPETFTVGAPEVGLEIEQCVAMPSAPCALIAGAEAAVVNVSVPGETAQDVFVTWTVNGITHSESRTVRADRPAVDVIGNARMAGRASIPAPLAVGGTQWVLTARAGASLSQSREVTLVAPALVLSVEQCDGGACRLVAGVDTAVVHVTLPGEAVQDVQLGWTLNGITQADARTIRAEQPIVRADGKRAVTGRGTVPAPAAPGALWSLTGRVGPTVSNTQHIALAAPTLDVSVQGCDGGGCAVTAAVGTVAIDVTVEGAAPADAELTFRIDGVLQPGSTRFRLERPVTGPDGVRLVTGTTFVDVPVAADQARWRIEARARDVTAQAPDMTLVAPAIRAELSCGTACMLRSGQMTTLTVRAPNGIRPAQATVSTRVNDAPSSSGVVVNLDRVDVNARQAYGQVTLTVPALAPDAGVAIWQIDATVGAYRATSLLESIAP